MSMRANFADIYLQGMRNRSMRSGTDLAREIQLTDWSTAGERGKLVLVVSTKPSLAQFISLFTTGKNRLSIVQITHQLKFFTLRFLSRKKVERKFVWTNKFFFFVTSIQFVACALRENLSNRSSGVQIPRDICTRFGRYLWSTKCSWMIKTETSHTSSSIVAFSKKIIIVFFSQSL